MQKFNLKVTWLASRRIFQLHEISASGLKPGLSGVETVGLLMLR
jgi:hypothetical protein